MKKNRLNTSAAFEGLVFGVSASVKGYRLCHFINKELNINLQKPESAAGLGTANGPALPDPFMFIDDAEEWGFNFYLVPNNTGNGFLYPKHKNVNFILILPGANETIIKNSFLKSIQSISVIQAIFKLEGDHSKTLKTLNLD